MSTARFKLDMFEGPLDLLLHLINKHKLNIYDIEIAVLLEQYLEYMAGLEEEDYEDAADFLEMAARLIYIKTASLLPKDDEGEELKKELQGSLIEYSLCKMAAARLREQYAGGDIFVREPVKLPVKKTFSGEKDPQELLAAYLGMSEKARHSKPLKAEMFKPILSRKIVSVTSKIIHVLKMLITQGECFLDSMYDGCADKSERVAVFLAVLELTRSGRIFLNDDNTRVYMNSASKNRRIGSAFDEAEIAAENGAEDPYDAETASESEISRDSAENISREETPENEERELSEEENSEKARFSDISPYGYEPRGQESTTLPYNKMYEPPERTVYKSETRQRGALPVLKIELSPELQKIVEQGRKDMPPDMAEENTATQGNAESTEITVETAVTVNLAKPVSEETPAAEETTATQENAENTDITAETSVIVSLAKPVSEETPAVEEATAPQENAENADITAETAIVNLAKPVSEETPAVEETTAMQENAVNTDISTETAILNLAKPVSEETTAAEETTATQENAENTDITAETAEVANDETVSEESTHLRENLFGFRYYWGAYGWLNGRLRT